MPIVKFQEGRFVTSGYQPKQTVIITMGRGFQH